MAVNETIVTGRKFRKCIDEINKLWQRISFWTKASDVEFDDAKTAELKVGAIDGITDSLASTSSRIAASAKSVNQLSNNLTTQTAKIKKVRTYVGSDKKLHFVNSEGVDTALNFSNAAQCVLIQSVSASSDAAITINVKNKVSNYQSLTQNDFILKVTSVYSHTYTSMEYNLAHEITPTLSYNQSTGIVTITGLYAQRVSSTNNEIDTSITADLYAFPNGLKIS